jgi:hypothetical protein
LVNELDCFLSIAAVILAFIIGASLMLGAAIVWLASASGNQYRDGSFDHALLAAARCEPGVFRAIALLRTSTGFA